MYSIAANSFLFNAVAVLSAIVFQPSTVSAAAATAVSVQYDVRFDVDKDGQLTKEEVVEGFRLHSEAFKKGIGSNINENHEDIAIPHAATAIAVTAYKRRVMYNNQLFYNFQADPAKEAPIIALRFEEDTEVRPGSSIKQVGAGTGAEAHGVVAVPIAITTDLILVKGSGVSEWATGPATLSISSDTAVEVQLVEVRAVPYPGCALEDLERARIEYGDKTQIGFWGNVDENGKGVKSGMRIPLAFNVGPPSYNVDGALYRQFQFELLAALEEGGITDAIVQQIGSATQGWKGNPKKPLNPWTHLSDVDLAIFSEDALVQAKELETPYNPKVIVDGHAVVFKNTAMQGEQDVGFYQTKVGKVLERLSTKWTNKIYSNFAGWQGKLDDFDFKLNVSPEPFEDGSTIISQRNDDVFEAFPVRTKDEL